VMGAMHEFLRYLETPEACQLLENADALWTARAADLNTRLAAEGLPLRIAALGSIWTFLYETASRYHWMLQYYLRAEGLTLSWVGSGRVIFSLDYTTEDYSEVAERILHAARRMREAGWWWMPPVPRPWQALRRQLGRELIQLPWRAWSGSISSPRSRCKGARQ
jgi:glutamate-1-semialdehyde 2,1-aminomutase